MTSINLQNLLIQRDDTRDRLLIAWGRVSAELSLPVVSEIEGLAHELDLLTKIHMHAVANGSCPASLVAVLAQITERQKARFNASEPESAVETPELDLREPQSPRPARETKPANPETPALHIAAGDTL